VTSTVSAVIAEWDLVLAANANFTDLISGYLKSHGACSICSSSDNRLAEAEKLASGGQPMMMWMMRMKKKNKRAV
jgi:hypothetical protein